MSLVTYAFDPIVRTKQGKQRASIADSRPPKC
jgi:hypothetical protein